VIAATTAVILSTRFKDFWIRLIVHVLCHQGYCCHPFRADLKYDKLTITILMSKHEPSSDA
ncbi:hypothetical protein OFN51_34440, partial [Escherichia coli]|nr:hypothetical protein [Escherichia coli]